MIKSTETEPQADRLYHIYNNSRHIFELSPTIGDVFFNLFKCFVMNKSYLERLFEVLRSDAVFPFGWERTKEGNYLVNACGLGKEVERLCVENGLYFENNCHAGAGFLIYSLR